MNEPFGVRLSWPRSTVGVFTTVVIGAIGVILLFATVYVASGEVNSVADALFEATAGLTTTSLTVLDPETLPSWLLIWRGFTQWTGGVAALLLALIVLPNSGPQRGLSNIASSHQKPPESSNSGLCTKTRIILIYTGFSGAIMTAYALFGMSVRDAVTFGFTTASTGGFANYHNSVAHFDSAAIEWIAAVAMGLAGTSLAALVWLMRGKVGGLWRSTEVKFYWLLILVSTLLLAGWTWQDTGGGTQTIRQCFFVTTSSISTTGLRLADWGQWSAAPQTLMLMLIGIGAMAGSAGGGFQVRRVLEILGIVRRELVLQLHPQAVVPVQVSGVSVSQDALTRVQNFQILWVLAAAVGVFGVASLGTDLITAVSVSVSALATAGPALGEFTGFVNATVLAAPARAVLMGLMVLGWLAIYPIVVVVGWGIGEVQRLRLKR